MCYKVISHTLRCDVRPIICDGHQIYVDPFHAPSRCNCNGQPWIKPRFRCAEHPCCMRTEKYYYCPKYLDCEVLQYHRYEQTRKRNVWTQGASDEHLANAYFQQEDWPFIKVFEDGAYLCEKQVPGFAPFESDLYRRTRLNTITTGRLIGDMLVNIQDIEIKLKTMREDHEARHGSCERVLNPWECREVAQMQKLEAVIQASTETLAKQMQLFHANLKLFEAVKLQEKKNVFLEELLIDELSDAESLADEVLTADETPVTEMSPESPKLEHYDCDSMIKDKNFMECVSKGVDAFPEMRDMADTLPGAKAPVDDSTIEDIAAVVKLMQQGHINDDTLAKDSKLKADALVALHTLCELGRLSDKSPDAESSAKEQLVPSSPDTGASREKLPVSTLRGPVQK